MAQTSEAISEGTEVPARHSEGASFPPFDSTTYSSAVFWLTISFVILYLAMSRVALPRVQSILQARRDRIDHDLETARSAKLKADEAALKHEKLLADARVHAQNLAAKAREAIDEQIRDEQAKLEAELNERLKQAEDQIAMTKTQVLRNVPAIATQTTISLLARLTGQSPELPAVEQAILQASSLIPKT